MKHIIVGCIALIACPALAQSNSRADEEISQSKLALSAFECSLLATDNKEARRLFDIGFAAGKKFLDETSKLTADERTRVTGEMDLLWWGAWDGKSDVVGPTWKPSADFLGHSFWGPTIDFILGRVFSERAEWAYRGGRDSVDHPPGAHDDVINAAAGAIVAASQREAQRVPLVGPIIIGKSQPPQPATSTTEAFYEYYSGSNQYWGPV